MPHSNVRNRSNEGYEEYETRNLLAFIPFCRQTRSFVVGYLGFLVRRRTKTVSFFLTGTIRYLSFVSGLSSFLHLYGTLLRQVGHTDLRWTLLDVIRLEVSSSSPYFALLASFWIVGRRLRRSFILSTSSLRTSPYHRRHHPRRNPPLRFFGTFSLFLIDTSRLCICNFNLNRVG